MRNLRRDGKPCDLIVVAGPWCAVQAKQHRVVIERDFVTDSLKMPAFPFIATGSAIGQREIAIWKPFRHPVTEKLVCTAVRIESS